MGEDDGDGKGALVKAGAGDGALATDGWRGDDHKLQVEAATEAGLVPSKVEVDLYTEGFKSALVLRDPADGAVVVHGRTVLDESQLAKSLRPILMFLKINKDNHRLRVHDGEFELRVDGAVADASTPVIDAGKEVLKIWLSAGVIGFAIAYWFPGLIAQGLAAAIWGIGLLYGGWYLRQSMVSGRALLGARLSTALGMLAQEEQLILPPAGD